MDEEIHSQKKMGYNKSTIPNFKKGGTKWPLMITDVIPKQSVDCNYAYFDKPTFGLLGKFSSPSQLDYAQGYWKGKGLGSKVV